MSPRLHIVLVIAAAVVFAASGCTETPPTTPQCGFAEQLLPYEVGHSWSYRVTDLSSGERALKQQWLDRIESHPTYGEVIVQITEKPTGRTESLLRREGERVLRFEQRDYDQLDVLERTTLYQPYRLRVDESLAPGDRLVEQLTRVVSEPGQPDEVTEVTDEWEVLGDDEACEAPLGVFRCARMQRIRTAGGFAAKEFFFARGLGKVIENGTKQLEEVQSCASSR